MNEQMREFMHLIQLEICIRQMVYAFGMTRRVAIWHIGTVMNNG